MGRFAFCGPDYTSQSITADCQLTENFYTENVESGQGKSSVVLYPTPGLVLKYQLPTSPCRGNGQLAINGREFIVAGNTLYELFANLTYTARGTVANDGKPVSMAASQPIAAQGTPQLAIVSGGSLYVLNLLTNTMTIPVGPVGTPLQIVYADGFYVLLNTNGIFQFSAALDATNWPGIETQATTSYSDQTIAIKSVHRELFTLSALKGTTYYNAGDSPIPFDEISGGDFEQGTEAPWSLTPVDNTLFFIGANKNGGRMAWRLSGYTPTRISNHALEFAMQGYSTISDAVSYSYQDQGHEFYVCYFPTANVTWVYDCSTQGWHRRSFWNATTGQKSAHRSCSHSYVFGMHLVGDPTNGHVYQMSINQTMDFDNVIRRVRRAPHISNEDEWMFYEQLQVIAETGLTPSQLLPGNATPTFFNFQDSSLNYWNMGINDVGALTTAPALGSTVQTLFLNDSGGLTSWQVTISTLGVIQATNVTLNSTYPTFISMNSSTGQSQWHVQVTNLGILQTAFVATIYRNPTMLMRFSDDGAHTWSNAYPADTGAPGHYKARMIWRRLGRARDRVFEITVTDPIPWRIVDAYVKATPGYIPTERLTDRVRKMA